MKEIKFRLIDRDKIVGYEKWYSGAINKETGLYIAYPKWLYSEDSKYWSPTLITHRFKNEFTGLRDKNGKEIWEGDIVKTPGFTMPHVQIVWDDKDLSWTLGGWPIGRLQVKSKDIEIIGDIYSNPELLEVK